MVFNKHETKYLIMMSLVASFFMVELIVAIISGSLALRTDAFHMATDFFALTVAVLSVRMTKKDRSVAIFRSFSN